MMGFRRHIACKIKLLRVSPLICFLLAYAAYARAVALLRGLSGTSDMSGQALGSNVKNIHIREAGLALKQAIQAEYHRLKDNAELTAPSAIGHDMSGAISGQIYIGMDFGEAEDVLRAEGFKVTPRPGIDNPLGNTILITFLHLHLPW
jgi:hypothetical protein